MRHVILIDFGSTFTKAAVVSVQDQAVVFTTKVPSTVSTDATVCLNACLEQVRAHLGEDATAKAARLASSSAAGGLRMAVCGLSPSLSVAAGRNVSFGAGARIVHVAAGELTGEDLDQIAAKRTEIVLLCGGYEGGNESTLLRNAEVLGSSELSCQTIFAGNSQVASRVKEIMRRGGHECFIVANVMPQVGLFDAVQAESTVRNLFMQRIVDMKGLGAVRAELGEILMPTPAAVLSAGELLARGTATQQGLGDLMIVDIGGATTDIHSYAPHAVAAGVRSVGSAEPYAKRTVEGDLGMRESSETLCLEAGAEQVASDAGMSAAELEESIAHRLAEIDYVPAPGRDRALDQVLAQHAARLASRRHAGRTEPVISVNCRRLQRGKNLTSVRAVLGTGGVVVNSEHPADVLRAVLSHADVEPDVLLPSEADLYVDQDYVLFAAGLLRSIDDDLALAVLRNSLRSV